jgi:spoIIIJ-associated protein
MEWVETTAKTLDAAREAALDQLGVAAEDAEFDIIEEPRPGLFGRVRGEARLRARVRPAPVRPKQDRRRRGRSANGSGGSTPTDDTTASNAPSDTSSDTPSETSSTTDSVTPADASSDTSNTDTEERSEQRRSGTKRSRRPSTPSSPQSEESNMSTDDRNDDQRPSTVTPDEVAAAAVAFMEGLAAAFGADATVEVQVDGTELDVRVAGSELGLLVGPGGRTLTAVQDLARVAAQRRLGDHETRLRVDVAGYRERREAALSAFARDVAEQVRSSGTARSLEPMTSADRKVVHDVLNEESGVASRSVGEDPDRRIIVEPT